MKTSNYIKLEFPSKSANEAFARTAAAIFASQLDPTLDEISDIKTAVSEAVTNCIVHAYPNEMGIIKLKACIRGDILEIVITDKGAGIADVEKAVQPLFTTGGSERSGMGFTIMDSFMDKMKVRSKEGKGTTVTLCKRIRTRTYE